MCEMTRVRVYVSASSPLQPRVRRHLASCQDTPARLSNVSKLVLMTLNLTSSTRNPIYLFVLSQLHARPALSGPFGAVLDRGKL